MHPLMSELGIGFAAFVSTDIDDLFLLAAFFADPRMRPGSIVAGQYLGIGALFLVSALAAALALSIPEGWVALLGIVPLFLGVRELLELLRISGHEDPPGEELRERERRAERRFHLQALAVASVTMANGGDNLGVYIPLFATRFESIPVYGLVFAVMTGFWCAASHRLVNHRLLAGAVRRYGRIVLPVVLMALGLSILSGARALLRG